MSKIHVMSDNLANKIAAGEVVERISSVVKELVENSIDAKSHVISIDLIDSGTKLIKVTDDGIGMDKEDATLCFQRHATSKLLKEDDLFFINTLGFRGEALPSIASVSKVDLKTSQGGVGTHVVINGGTTTLVEASEARTGTTISIADLFYNTPARLKYLKSNATELANVTSFIEKLALSYPAISFTLTNNDKRIVYTSGSGDLLKTIHEIYGYTVSSNMIEISSSNDDYDLRGYICKPSVLKSNRNHMITIVNGRVVKNMDLNRAILDGYYKFRHDSQFPVVVLEIDTDPTLIDVNVHPTKQDIKFSKMDVLTYMVVNTIQERLRNTLLITNVEAPEEKCECNHSHEEKSEYVTPSLASIVSENEEEYKESEQVVLDFKYADSFNADKSFEDAKEVFEKLNNFEEDAIKKLELYPCGELFGTYIVAQNEYGMYLIDHHAAQERINYERILEEFKNEKIKTISMLIPITIELSTSEFLTIKENLDTITSLGFVVEEFGINTFVVKEHPTWLISGREEACIRKLFDIIIQGEYKFDKLRFRNHVAATMACKMSVRGNESITIEEATALLHDLVLCKDPYNCAHGRPSMISFSKYELDKMFKRVMWC